MPKSVTENLRLILIPSFLTILSQVASRVFSNLFGDVAITQMVTLALSFSGYGTGLFLASRLRWSSSRVYSVLLLCLGYFALLWTIALGRPDWLASTLWQRISWFTWLLLQTTLGILLAHSIFLESSRGFSRFYRLFNFALAAVALVGAGPALVFLGVRGSIYLLFGLCLVGLALSSRNPIRTETESEPISRRTLTLVCGLSLVSGLVQFYLFKLIQITLAPLEIHGAYFLASLLIGWGIAEIVSRKLNRGAYLKLLVPAFCLAVLWVPAFWWGFAALRTSLTEHRVALSSLSIQGLKLAFCLGITLPSSLLFGIWPYLWCDSRDPKQTVKVLAYNHAFNGIGLLICPLFVFEILGFRAAAVISAAALFAIILVQKTSLPRYRILTPLFAAWVLWVMFFPEANLALPSSILANLNDLRPYSAALRETRSFKKSGSFVNLLTLSDGERILSMNGHYSVYSPRSTGTAPVDTLLGLHGISYARRSNRALIIGLGTGATALGASRTFSHLDIVEIDPNMRSLALALGEPESSIVTSPSTRYFESDGGRFMNLNREKYDLIVYNIPTPLYGLASKMWSREILSRVADSLNEGGVFSLSLYSRVNPQAMHVLLSGISSLFGECRALLLDHHEYALTCSRPDEKLTKQRSIAGLMPSLSDEIIEALEFPISLPDPQMDQVSTLNHPTLELSLVWNPPDWKPSDQDSVFHPQNLERFLDEKKCKGIQAWLKTADPFSKALNGCEKFL